MGLMALVESEELEEAVRSCADSSTEVRLEPSLSEIEENSLDDNAPSPSPSSEPISDDAEDEAAEDELAKPAFRSSAASSACVTEPSPDESIFL